MSYHTIYCTYQAFELIYLQQEKLDVWSLIFRKYADIVVGLTEDELVNNELLIAFKRETPNLKLGCETSIFKGIYDSDLTQYSRDIFILDADAKSCATLRKQHGILIISIGEILKQEFLGRTYGKKFIDKGKVYKTEIKPGVYKVGWEAVLHNFDLTPLNSIVVNDSYILNSPNQKKSLNNTINLFKALLPPTLGCSFDILIMTINERGRLNTSILEDFANSVLTELKKYFSYKINLTIFTHSDHDLGHERLILTNYHYLNADKGFNTFDNDKATERNKVEISDAYSSIQTVGDVEITRMNSCLKEIKKELSNNLRSDPNFGYFLRVGNGTHHLLN